MISGLSVEVAAFDERTARYVVLGQNRSFPDPRSAQAAGCIVHRGPLTAAGVVTSPVEPVREVPRAPRVISHVRGTEHQPPGPRDRSPEPQPDAPRARRRR